MTKYRPLWLILAISFGVFAAHSQQGEDESQAPPPPKPIPPKEMRLDRITGITSVQGPDGRSGKFHSLAGGFKIAFPGSPEESVSDINGAFGPTKFTSYLLETSLASYVVAFIDFPVSMKDKLDLNIRFDVMRDHDARRLKGRVTEDSEFHFGTNYGRSLVIESDAISLSQRFVAVEQRLFFLSVYTRGALSRQSNTLRNANLKRINDFLNSFEVTEIPKTTLAEVELPDDFGIRVVEGSFKSSFFGISAQTPSGWNVMNEEEAEFLNEMGKEAVSAQKPAFVDFFTPDRMRLLFGASKKPLSSALNTATFMIIAEKAPFPNFKPISVANTYIKLFLDKDDVVTVQPTEGKFGALDMAWIETQDKATKTKVRIYWANEKGLALEFVLTFTSDAELQEMLGALNSVKRIEASEK
jgi:hypothetical protein